MIFTFFKGQQILRVPPHIESPDINDKTNWYYPGGIEPGFIMTQADQSNFFCRFWKYDSKSGLYQPILRTLSTSERVAMAYLVPYKFVAQMFVTNAIKAIEKDL